MWPPAPDTAAALQANKEADVRERESIRPGLGLWAGQSSQHSRQQSAAGGIRLAKKKKKERKKERNKCTEAKEPFAETEVFVLCLELEKGHPKLVEAFVGFHRPDSVHHRSVCKVAEPHTHAKKQT